MRDSRTISRNKCEHFINKSAVMAMRSRVLSCFKTLHRARQDVFEGDQFALKAGRTKINDEFKKNKHVTNTDSIEELVKTGENVAGYLKTSVVQAKLDKNKGTYALRITSETGLLKNMPYLGGDSKTSSNNT